MHIGIIIIDSFCGLLTMNSPYNGRTIWLGISLADCSYYGICRVILWPGAWLGTLYARLILVLSGTANLPKVIPYQYFRSSSKYICHPTELHLGLQHAWHILYKAFHNNYESNICIYSLFGCAVL